MSTTTPDRSIIEHHTGGGTSFVGPDAMRLFRAAHLAGALRLYAKTGLIPTRGVTSTVLLKLAGEITGKTYKRGEHLKAAEDVTVWVNTMKAAIPTTVDGVLQ